MSWQVTSPQSSNAGRVQLVLGIVLGVWLFVGVWWRVALNNADKVHFRDDVLFLPSRAGYLAEHGLKSKDCPAYKFDAVYPLRWPAGLKLPPDSYLLKSAAIADPAVSGSPIDPLVVEGFFNGSAFHYVQEIQDFAVSGGWKVMDMRMEEIPSDLGKPYCRVTHMHALKWISRTEDGQLIDSESLRRQGAEELNVNAGSNVGGLDLTLFEFEDMDGWMYFRLQAFTRDTPAWMNPNP